MKKMLNYLPFHFSVFLAIGIVFQYYTHFWNFGFHKIILLKAILICFFMIFRNRKITTLLSCLFFFFLGVSITYFGNANNYPSFYKHYITDVSSSVFVISKVLKSGNYYDKYEAEVCQINTYKTKGKVLLNIEKDSVKNTLQVDEKIYLHAKFKELTPQLNPHQFDYKKYLQKQEIYQQVFIGSHQYRSLGFSKITLKGIAAKIRIHILESLKKYHFEKDELAVIQALLLGQRRDISKELISDYAHAGAIHILAVSGLHVGIILLILAMIFKPLERFKNGKIVKTILIIVFLWMFAFIAGMSASVVRAVTMFTFLALGQSFKYKSNALFSLISSLFFLLLLEPLFLFDLGFQLSYLAVFTILWVQPKLYALWKPRYKIANKLWQLFTVSIAAQVGVLPLSLYYFHQFPGLFMLSNLVIVPFLGIILSGGVLVIILSLIGFFHQVAADSFGFIISLMNTFVSWVSKQEQFLYKDISLSFLMMLFLYVGIALGIQFLFNKSTKRLFYFLGIVVFIQTLFLFEKHQKHTQEAFIVFHKSMTSIFGERNGDKLYVYHTLDSLKENKIVKSYAIGEDILPIYKTRLKKVFSFKNRSILMVDSLGIYQIEGLQNPIVILQQSPKVHLKRLITYIQPSQIIADGNNYKSYINKWMLTCKEENIPFHYTGQKGAYIFY